MKILTSRIKFLFFSFQDTPHLSLPLRNPSATRFRNLCFFQFPLIISQKNSTLFRKMSSTIPDAQTNELGSHVKPEFVHTESSFSAGKLAELTIANTSSGKSSSKVYERNLGDNIEKQVFDICLHNKSGGGAVKLKKSFLEINKEKRRQEASSKEARHEYLRSGMVLLKKHLSHQDQVQIVKKCQELGIGEGGFYKPGYDDGAKLRLYMMCLGKNWDPLSRYEDKRSRDGATPPEIPEEFKKMVSGAIASAHEVIKLKQKGRRVEAELPPMSPDICIVNFYTNEGKLGLHQDKDESEESLRACLPVVSFSIGDSAEFLYSDERDESTAKRVVLESGDVLIFGGKSRRIFHGVPGINKKTAPALLVEETNLRPGRLNLTFRQY